MSKLINVNQENLSEEPIRHVQDWFYRLGKLATKRDLSGLTNIVEKFPEWVHEVDAGGWDGLMILSALGFADGVSLLINQKADVNRKAADGTTAFHAAVGPGHVGAALKIMDAGGDPTIQDKAGLSPMMMVCDKGSIQLFKIIFDKYPQSILGKDKKGRECYDYAAQKDHFEIISLMNDDRMRQVVPKDLPERVLSKI